jgi:hypothetical protein
VQREVREAAPAEGPGLVRHAQVTQRVDPGGSRGSCTGNTESRLLSSSFPVFYDAVPTVKCMKYETRKISVEGHAVA